MTRAIYATLCRRCDRLIHPGDPIAPTPDDEWVHQRCAAGGDDGGPSADEGQCTACGMIRRTHLLDGDRCAEGCW